MTEEKKIEILYDHYKDTFENQKVSLQKRNYYTIICLGLIVAFAFQISNPEQLVDISAELIKKNVGNVKIDFCYINSVLIFALFWVVILYYQVNLLIEKIYKYIHEIEDKLTNNMTPFEISREGKTYLKDYSWLSEVIHIIYTLAFPVTLILVAVVKWFSEKNQFTTPYCNRHFWVDTIFLFGIVLTSILYFINRQFNDFHDSLK